uniref:Uncharacterized protein n=1 Tax=Arundo donax TaxID=35708 RepID=A0A0A9CPT5_ARUDO
MPPCSTRRFSSSAPVHSNPEPSDVLGVEDGQPLLEHQHRPCSVRLMTIYSRWRRAVPGETEHH